MANSNCNLDNDLDVQSFEQEASPVKKDQDWQLRLAQPLLHRKMLWLHWKVLHHQDWQLLLAQPQLHRKVLWRHWKVQRLESYVLSHESYRPALNQKVWAVDG